MLKTLFNFKNLIDYLHFDLSVIVPALDYYLIFN
jgi:hypothetical protein